ncbi:MAG: prepilin-type N-terminal cleavage/methylation domain-containing protein [Candidatus Hydrogenedentes bacterium]|nr:prepilin-type N-terminal cleavage/methylation domain-containing protein [Candidatus Hydrogenedentota bacterium]
MRRRLYFISFKGFTLMEILTALAILGGSAFVLFNIHYNAMRLHEEALGISDEYQLLSFICSKAEMGVLSGTLSDGGDFGDNFEGYSWSYSATPMGSDPAISLYAVNVTLTNPEGETKNVNFLCYGLSMQTQENSLTGSAKDKAKPPSASKR